MTDDGSEGVCGPGRGVPHDEAAEHFDVEDAEGPVLDEVDDVSFCWGAKVRVQRNDDVEFDEEGEKGGE